MKKLKVGVIGCGVMGSFHVKQYRNIPEAELIGVSDADASRKTNDLAFFQDYQELLKQVDAVSIATPTFTHYEVANCALDAGCSVLIEKPIALTVDEGKKLISKAKAKGKTLAVGHIERFNPAYMKLEKELGRQRIDIIDIKRFSPFPARIADVSCVIDMMIHDIDLAKKLARSEVKYLNAQGIMVKTERLDKALAIIVFKNGTVANIEASRVHTDKVRQIIVASEKNIYNANLLNKKLKKQTNGRTEDLAIEMIDQLNFELKDFVNSVLNRKTPTVTGEDGLAALDIAEKVEALALRS